MSVLDLKDLVDVHVVKWCWNIFKHITCFSDMPTICRMQSTCHQYTSVIEMLGNMIQVSHNWIYNGRHYRNTNAFEQTNRTNL